MNDAERDRLIEAACAVRLKAYAPFSNFRVGAALLTPDGDVYVGCNVENVSYGLTICAERVAVGTSIAAGRHAFTAIAIASANGCTPCGACRQVLAEFAPDLPVYLVNVDGGKAVTELTMTQLLPGRFELGT